MLNDEIVGQFAAVLDQNDIALALFDAVVSMPGVRMPFEELSRLCKQKQVMSLVDGAHLIGLIPVDLGDTGFSPDFYVTNLHKWLSLPRGCAALYVDPKHHRTIQTMPISHSFVPLDGPLSKEELENLLVLKFAFTGSNTFAAFHSIKAALRFRNDVCGGEGKIREYCEDLARKAAQLTLEKWPGTVLMDNDEGLLVTSLVSLIIPIHQYDKTFDASDVAGASEFISFLSRYLVEKHRTFVMFGVHNDKVVMRFSAHLYNELSDYDYAIAAGKDAVGRYFREKKKEV